MQKVDPAALNEVAHERVMGGHLQHQARNEDVGEVAIPDLIGEQEDATLSALDRLTLAAREFEEEWGAVGTAVAGTFASLSDAMMAMFEATGSKGKAAFAAYKAFAVAEAVAATFLAANKALAAGPPPWNIAQAAAIVGIGLANVSKIMSASPGGGASAGGGGSAPGRSGITASGVIAPTPRPASPSAPPVNVRNENRVVIENRIQSVDGFTVESTVRRAGQDRADLLGELS